MKANR